MINELRKRITGLLSALLLLAAPGSLLAAELTVNVADLDNKSLRIVGPGVDGTHAGGAAIVIEYEEAGTFTIEMNASETISAYVQFEADEEGNITDVYWKDADGSQTGNDYVPLPGTFFSISGTTLTLSPVVITVNISDIQAPRIDWAQMFDISGNQSQAIQTYNVFCGDYIFVVGEDTPGGGIANIILEIKDTGTISPSIFWELYLDPATHAPGPRITLGQDFFDVDVGANSLQLFPYVVTMQMDFDNASIFIDQLNQTHIKAAPISMFPGCYDYRIGGSASPTANVQLVVDPVTFGIRSDIWWIDADSTQEDSVVTISGDFVNTGTKGDQLIFAGANVTLNLENVDNQLDLQDVVKELNQDGETVLKLFPGDYHFQLDAQDGLVIAETDVDGAPVTHMVSKYTGINGPVVATMDPIYYEIEGQNLTMKGSDLTIDMKNNPDQMLRLNGMAGIPVKLNPGETATKKLLPGSYLLDLVDATAYTAEAQLRIYTDGTCGFVSDDVLWNDIETNTTEGNFQPLSKMWLFRDKKSVIVIDHIPTPIGTGPADGHFAILRKELDAGYHVIHNGKLKFKYDERYEYSGPLDYTIYDDADHLDVTPVSCSCTINGVTTSNIAYGHNWVEMDLSVPGTFGQNEYYILEVRNQKDERWFLRFRYAKLVGPPTY